jgi:hypothetical protein
VQLAAEPTSLAAPRTVLQAATDKAVMPIAIARTFLTILVPPFNVRNDNESLNACLSTELNWSAGLRAVHGVFGAIRDRVHVARGAAHGVACGDRKGDTQKHDGCDFLQHVHSSYWDGWTNAAVPERLHCGSVIFSRRAAE